jgi:hypothetical protein
MGFYKPFFITNGRREILKDSRIITQEIFYSRTAMYLMLSVYEEYKILAFPGL